MAQNSNIEWTDHTFNPWIGCTKVSAGCKHCYAETLMDTRYGKVKWGPAGTRIRTSPGNWKLPLRWNRDAERKPWVCTVCGVRSTGLGTCNACEHIASGAPVLVQQRPRVFCASLADIFEDRPELAKWRADLFTLIDATPNLDWLLLTKRPENIARLWVPPLSSGEGPGVRPNVWLGTSVEDQAAAEARIPHLLRAAHLCKYTFLSCEPLLGPVDLTDFMMVQGGNTADPRDIETVMPGINWLIAGGESGTSARPMHPDWVRSLRDHCAAAGVPFLFKQWGEWCPASEEYGVTGHVMPDNDPKYTWIGWDGTLKAPSAHGLAEPIMAIARQGKHRAGRKLDGQLHNAFPTHDQLRNSSAESAPSAAAFIPTTP